MLRLVETDKTDKRLLARMEHHYSEPKGFVGRTLCYAVMYDGIYYGHIVGGSSAKHLPGRNEFLGMTMKDLDLVINNVFFNVNPVEGRYPKRNFTTMIVKEFMTRSQNDWYKRYGDQILGFETMIEPPRTGELYRRAGWTYTGTTKGITLKRENGQKVWNKDPNNLRVRFFVEKCDSTKNLQREVGTLNSYWTKIVSHKVVRAFGNKTFLFRLDFSATRQQELYGL